MKLHEIFYWFLNMSILGSLFGLLVCGVRLMKRIPRIFCYILWSVVCFRLLIPFGVSSKYSLLSLIGSISSGTLVRTVRILDSQAMEGGAKLSASNMMQVADSYHPITYKLDRLKIFFEISSLVWIVIGVVLLLFVAIMYGMTSREFRKATHLYDNIYQGNMVGTPTVYGIIRPKIILPAGIASHYLEYILAHERIHIRRRDNIWRLLAIFTACLHWFNPLVWLFLRGFLKDCELACDEGAIQDMDSKERSNYAMALFSYSSGDNTIFASAFGSSQIKLRIKKILSYQRLTLVSSLFMILMLVILMFLMLTNARA